jgi:Spy/CpxP family protein refolding chaperone
LGYCERKRATLFLATLQTLVPEAHGAYTGGAHCLQVVSDVRSDPVEQKERTMKKLIQSLVVAGLMATAGSAAFAQMDGGMMAHEGMHHMDPAKMAQMHTKHMADLKAKLKITASQEAAWNTFSDAMKPPADMMGKRPDRSEMDKLTTPERIDKMRAMHKEHMAAMETAMDKRGDATKALYAVLSPEQQKAFDAEFAKMGPRGGGDHKMMGHEGGKPSQPPKQ